jgi:hypothetical protein
VSEGLWRRGWGTAGRVVGSAWCRVEVHGGCIASRVRDRVGEEGWWQCKGGGRRLREMHHKLLQGPGGKLRSASHGLAASQPVRYIM